MKRILLLCTIIVCSIVAFANDTTFIEKGDTAVVMAIHDTNDTYRIDTIVPKINYPRGLGVRIGWVSTEISYQHQTSARGFVEWDLGWQFYPFPIIPYPGIQTSVVHNWEFAKSKPNTWGQWNAYAGVGGHLGCNLMVGLSVGVAGNIGFDYEFPCHIQLAIDYKPVLGIMTDFEYVGPYMTPWALFDAAFSIRYGFH